MTCSICSEDYTPFLRRKITCFNNECESNYCLLCFKNFLLKSEDFRQECMTCSVHMSIIDIFKQCNTSTFVKDIIEITSANVLKTQKSLLPQDQPEARIILNRKNFGKFKAEKDKEIRILQMGIASLHRECNDEWDKKCIKADKKTDNEFTFIKECSYDGCKGLLTSAWKCPLCENFTCSKCHTPKENKEDHVCNEDIAKNIQALKKDTKPCPRCGMGIFKIDGCDQMWCIECQTAFSWRTGKLEKTVHNPEYYRWMREHNTVIPRNPDEGRGFEINECFDPFDDHVQGQILRYYNRLIAEYTDSVKISFFHSSLKKNFDNLFRFGLHIKFAILSRYELDLAEKLKSLRVSYLVKDITEEKWLSEIKRRTKEKNKKEAQYNIIVTFLRILGDIIMNILYILENIEIDKLDKITEIDKQIGLLIPVIDNTNKELFNARSLFKSKESYLFHLIKTATKIRKDTDNIGINSFIDTSYKIELVFSPPRCID